MQDSNLQRREEAGKVLPQRINGENIQQAADRARKRFLIVPVSLGCMKRRPNEPLMQSMERFAPGHVTREDQVTTKPTSSGKSNAAKCRRSRTLKKTAPGVSYP